MALTPPPRGACPDGGVEMTKILHFLFIVVESSSETSHSASNSTGNGRAMHYRSEFDDYAAKISHYYYFSAGGREPPIPDPYLLFLPKVVPFDKISVYRSDPRHVAKLTSRIDGLDMVSMAGACEFDGF